MNIVVNSYVNWKSDDCTYNGVVSNIDEHIISLDVPNIGTLNVPVNDGEFTIIDKIDESINLSNIEVESTEIKMSTKRVVKRSKTGKNKVEMMLDIIKEFPNLTRKEYIEIGVEREVSSFAGCSTFYNSAKKLI